ncbi:transketolase [Gammaproteobacteria bacterium SCGC AG-212-F23]|nr:transketolase [Gammaproteobacteria bacterium SCGC AG-212-F23]
MTTIEQKIHAAKKRLLEMHFHSKVGHIGGNLSCLDALMTLHHEVMRPEDTFILSKGHSAGALYITLWSLGKIKDNDLKTFHGENTWLSGHPVPGWMPEIPVATGSLGHGLSVAVGIALGRQLTQTPGHVYCLTSDGEWQEGSMWEALIFYAHRQLSNMTILVDCNRLQGFGNTTDTASMADLAKKLAAFNVPVTEANGQNPKAIVEAIKQQKHGIIVLNTTKGAGISFMENKMEWHYLPLNEQQFHQAMAELT